MTLELRRLERLPELRACEALQDATWGEDFSERVPGSLMLVAGKVGGLTAGAFLPGSGPPEERLAGFVFGLSGWRGGDRVHWSHLLAVAKEARGRGIGRRLKLFQRKELLAAGVETAFWTFDPLVARNAHLNLNRLGAEILEFVPDLYGTEARSLVHPGGPTDRFIVRWRLEGERARRAIEAGPGPDGDAMPAATAPVIDPLEHEASGARGGELPGGGAVRIAVPADYPGLCVRDPEAARRWRSPTRRLFLRYLERGYRVDSLEREAGDARSFYHLVEAEEQADRG